MERFFPELPSLNRKEEIIEYLNEFVEYKSDINGIGMLSKIVKGMTFEEALDGTLNAKDAEFAKKIGRAQSKTFLLIRESDNRIVGSFNVRWNLTPEMIETGGYSHIGYGIRPTERNKGYNKINLYLALCEAKELGLERVMLDCEATNIASERTMQALGGNLTKTEIDPIDGLLTKVYWFNVNECLNMYKDLYEPQIRR